MEQKYEQEIQMLQQEIEKLEAAKEENLRELFIQHGEELQKRVQLICEDKGGAGHQRSLSKLITEIREMEEDLQRQTEINSIVLKSCFVKTLLKSDEKRVQQFRLQGHCNPLLLVEVEFELTEIQETDNLLRTITQLNLVVNGDEFRECTAFFSRVEETKDLLLFFRTFKMFSARYEERCRTLKHFQEKHPDVVTLPEGSRSKIMIIRSPQVPGISMTIVWTIGVSTDGDVRPSLQLVPKVPDQAREMDAGVMEHGPAQFQSVLQVLGVEASIEALIRTVSV